ncbi:transposable element Tcb2 transposase [Trichonephila clavipes]|nr:transposable element Tcb2 transposase [Trichonephila clavipes]
MQRLPGAIFQQDNARPHTARVSQDCLCTVSTLPWPARSPDLSPIEHIWDHLGWKELKEMQQSFPTVGLYLGKVWVDEFASLHEWQP